MDHVNDTGHWAHVWDIDWLKDMDVTAMSDRDVTRRNRDGSRVISQPSSIQPDAKA